METCVCNTKYCDKCPCEVGEWPCIPMCPCLATAYVPYQKPERVYKCIDALMAGTIFPDLDMPYKCFTAKGTCNKNSLYHMLMAIDFALIDLMMYLDTHPCDCGSRKLANEYAEKLCEIKKKYERKYGPLTASSSARDCDDKWEWICGPWPWENSCNRRV